MLICDVSDAVVAPHLTDEHRKDAFVDVLRRKLQPEVERNYDVIALCERVGWGTPLALRFCVCSGDRYHPVVGERFGPFEQCLTVRDS